MSKARAGQIFYQPAIVERIPCGRPTTWGIRWRAASSTMAIIDVLRSGMAVPSNTDDAKLRRRWRRRCCWESRGFSIPIS